mmetsp:Transcript_9966/g.15039  ORF Transcript_9966/g.15039 Transcript_9966/m.15039 type:complete len:259 (+) Transcript_9966:38-814(+)
MTSIESITDTFHQDGYCIVDSLFSDLNIDSLRTTALENYEEIQRIIADRGLYLGIGIKEGYDEIVQRHTGRYEVPYKMKNSFRLISEHPVLLQLVHHILGPDIVIANESLLVSVPGAQDQAWHSDGPHMSVTEYLPCHVLNVFVPLIDITLAEGPTEFRPGSQRLTLDLKNMFLRAFASKQLRKPVKPTLRKGSALLFDYRVLHRGTANRTDAPRPVYVVTFAKSWYKDTLNFPGRSVFATRSGEANETINADGILET